MVKTNKIIKFKCPQCGDVLSVKTRWWDNGIIRLDKEDDRFAVSMYHRWRGACFQKQPVHRIIKTVISLLGTNTDRFECATCGKTVITTSVIGGQNESAGSGQQLQH